MLFVGDDWAEDHHDVEVQDEARGSRRHHREAVGVSRTVRGTGPRLTSPRSPRPSRP